MSHAFKRPDRRTITDVTNTVGIWSDDFGGSALDNRWTVLQGGQGAVSVGDTNVPASMTAQAAIGSGTTGMTYSVAASALTVNMNTTSGAELWFVSTTTFGGSEDITVVLSKSQALAANSLFIGLAECDPLTGNLLLNPNLANDFTNRGGVEFAATTNLQAAAVQTVADSSSVVASNSGAAFAPANMTTAFETVIELHAEDVIASASVVDTVGGKQPAALRVSSQVPNDTKAYKLVMRFKNVSGPATNTIVTVGRILVVDSQEMRVEVTSGRGDQNAQKAVAVNLAQGLSTGSLGSVTMDAVSDGALYNASLSATGVFNLNGATGFNTAGFGWGEVAFPSPAVGTQVWIEGSPDGGTTWISVLSWQNSSVSSPNAVPAATFYPTIYATWMFPVQFPLMRVRLSSISSGTITAYLMLKRGQVPAPIVVSTIKVDANSVARWTSGASGVIKASNGIIKSWIVQNTNAAARYLQIYNKAAAGIPGTDTPILTIPMAATSLQSLSGIAILAGTGLSWAITTDAPGVTAGASGDIVGAVEYL